MVLVCLICLLVYTGNIREGHYGTFGAACPWRSIELVIGVSEDKRVPGTTVVQSRPKVRVCGLIEVP